MDGLSAGAMHRRTRVGYTYDHEVGNFSFGAGHPMKPHRMRMAHSLICAYGLYKKMEVFRPALVDDFEMSRFHSDDYIKFLRTVSPDNMQDHLLSIQRYAIGDDCPVFDGLYDFCRISASGSIGGAARLNSGELDVCINWSGGLHHAKKSEASGFCYVNDCVLAILELLKVHQRVLYIDIDIHHGDGVEEAFYTTDRVMTVSFHKFGDYFPGTGHWKDIGVGKGKNTSINFPLRDGIDDESYRHIFRPVMSRVIERFRPEAIVMQCGADSLAGDRLGCFNMTVRGHGDCVDYIRSFGIPLMLLGGGGYTMRNVARCWTYETSVVLGQEIPNELPFNAHFEYFGPDYHLHISPSNMENRNDRRFLEGVTGKLLEALNEIEIAPSTQILTGAEGDRLPKPLEVERAGNRDTDPDVRESKETGFRRVVHEAEFYDGPGDQDPTAGTAAAAAAAGAGGEADVAMGEGR